MAKAAKQNNDEVRFVEFPKWVPSPDGAKDRKGFPVQVLVKDKAEEDALLGAKADKKAEKKEAWK
jgi:hypothetical protein